MAANDKKQTIIIKKIVGGHGGSHGGAWKVAYADFVTAMMCFFLVMWLMGSDEETKAKIASYFNNPTAPLRLDMTEDPLPLGDRTAAGDNVLKGAEGQVPEDMIERPSRKFVVNAQEGKKKGEVIDRLLEDQLDLQSLRFTVP